MSTNKINRILLTGPPGIGKTTAIQEVCHLLKRKNISVLGFFTKEVRNSHQTRIGFDIVTLDGKHGVLARIMDRNEAINYKYTVGNYAVFVNEFESLVLPILMQQNKDVIFIIDEIGKMELFSRSFEQAVMDLFKAPNIKIIATIPVKPMPFIQKLKSTPSTTIITVDRSNRDNVPAEILNSLNIQ